MAAATKRPSEFREGVGGAKVRNSSSYLSLQRGAIDLKIRLSESVALDSSEGLRRDSERSFRSQLYNENARYLLEVVMD